MDFAWRLLSLVSPVWRLGVPRSRLRVLTYHRVPEAGLFRRHVVDIVERYSPVGADAVVGFMRGELLSPRSCWLTFDDGDSSVMNVALPLLEEFSIPATLFVCPGFVDTAEPYWWQVIETAAEFRSSKAIDDSAQETIATLKRIPDRDRRSIVEEIRGKTETQMGVPMRRRQVTTGELRRWQERGRTIGNHTWDHPILDMCDETEQHRQIHSAHEWLTARFGQVDLFAYPNGNHSDSAEVILNGLGYNVAAVFDHQLTRRQKPLRASRLRMNATDDLDRFRAKVSGLHPLLHRLLGRP